MSGIHGRLWWGLWQTGEDVPQLQKIAAAKPKHRSMAARSEFSKAAWIHIFMWNRPNFLMLTTNSNLQHSVSQTKHICKLSVQEPSVFSLSHKKKNTWFFGRALWGRRHTLCFQQHTIIWKHMTKYGYTSETPNCWRKARNYPTLHTLKKLHFFHQIRNCKQNPMEENIGKYFCETEFTNIQLPQYVHQLRLLNKKTKRWLLWHST